MSEDIEDFTEAPFLGGRLLLRQTRKGHRAGTDAILLAAAAPAEAKGLALDVGAGVGAAGLALAKLRPQIALGLIDNDSRAVALARLNLGRNGVPGSVYEADVFDPATLHGIGPAQLVITNPPFLDPARTRLAADPGKRNAHAMPQAGPGPLAAWISACLALLEEDGTFVLIHKPEALSEILNALTPRAGALALLPVQPRAHTAAIRILIRAQKGSRAPLSIAPALVLNDEHGFLPNAEAIHRGEALIAW